MSVSQAYKVDSSKHMMIQMDENAASQSSQSQQSHDSNSRNGITITSLQGR
jgi:hypothetical protein